MKTPHILLATSNVVRMRQNLAHVLDTAALTALDGEIRNNVIGLFKLGRYHLDFAKTLPTKDWRQECSRLYYAAYNMQRAVRLADSGNYSTDSTDHKKIGSLPAAFPKHATYEVQLPILREDRNLCDYDHSAAVTDLAIAIADARALVNGFAIDAASFLLSKGITT